MKIAIILGTRPEIIKMSPIIRACQEKHVDFLIIHTNQHYSPNLDKIFFDELNIPSPNYNLHVGSGPHSYIISQSMKGIEEILLKERPDFVLVEGDTDTVLAGALAAMKVGVRVGHVEAGLRSYDEEMPEELNRILVDYGSSILFSPTENNKNILLKEGIPQDRVFVTGNTIVDAVLQNLSLANQNSKILEKLNLIPREYFLITAHRQEKVDIKERLRDTLKGLELIYKEHKKPIIYPIHPRTMNRINEFGMKVPEGISLLEPLGYLDFLVLMEKSSLVITDSGGIQEETCVLKVPCVTIRNDTERPETIEVGSNIIAGMDPDVMFAKTNEMLNKPRDWVNPFGDGKAAEKILEILLNYKNNNEN